MYLDQIEVQILNHLAEQPADRRWCNAVDIAARVEHHQQLIRSRLKTMTRFGWVERGGWGEGWGQNWGRYRITQSGRHELAHHNQMRLVV